MYMQVFLVYSPLKTSIFFQSLKTFFDLEKFEKCGDRDPFREVVG